MDGMTPWHLITRHPGSDTVKVSAHMTPAEIRDTLRQGELNEPVLHAALASESPGAFARPASGAWVAVAECDGECEATALTIANFAEAEG